MELERVLHRQGFGSRKTCRALVRAGRVAIAGSVIEDPFLAVDTEGLVLSVDGQDWPYREKATLLLHKPAGYECSRRPIHHPSVYSLLPAPLLERGVQSVGRLDEDTTGLLIFSDDGQLNHVLTSPRHKVPKTYRVTLKHGNGPALAERLLAGVQLHDEPAPIHAAACEVVEETVLHLTVTEGKYHQVKRMIAAAGDRVEALHRISVGGVGLPDNLAVGQWRWMSAEEVLKLRRVE